ncbi:putative serine esterase-domain-containing protein [Podospora didyma]|uniref:Serine esterase-domain-containing protein n=1 Tax=Podospora didyma TaxID=330526 RepID=A0AAE0KJZ8_9PEZI|nr:putative serine esterase-domain-containing protein [Podospora didyma]
MAEEYSGGSPEADHLCVVVHGASTAILPPLPPFPLTVYSGSVANTRQQLWGNPNHMTQIAKALREKYPRDKLHLLVAKRNSGSFTYDGIELGGERVCLEIEEEIQMIESRGGKIKKLSMVGYSLGGLVARYAIGLLYARGVLDKVECMNFTAFASPFIGIRSPLLGLGNDIWNVLGARSLCMSGRQLFGIDKFRDTGKPLVAVLADPKSIFMSGLAKFQRHTLYANVTNDRSAVYYTTCIAKTDPYTDMSKVHAKFVPGYEDVILDPVQPLSSTPPKPPPKDSIRKWLKRVPFVLTLTVLVPIFLTAFFINSGIQTVRSSRRVKLHEQGRAGVKSADYRVNLWIQEMREAVEHTYEDLNSAQDQAYLTSSSSTREGGESSEDDEEGQENHALLAAERKQSQPGQPTLALAPYQFAAVRALDKLNWRKYPVWIHKVSHSHAAIISRIDKETYSEGKVVLRHFVNEEFVI